MSILNLLIEFLDELVFPLSVANAAFILTVYTGIGLIGDFLLIPFWNE